VPTDLALEGHGCPELLSCVGKAEISLETDTVVQTTLEDVCATKGMLSDRDTARLNISLGKADALILVTQLGYKACMNITLKESGINVNRTIQFATFIECVHYAFLVLEWILFVLQQRVSLS
jgi:hypothetical protein